MTHTPTKQQNDILDLSTNSNRNIMIRALAGTGKTSTLEMIERRIFTKPVLYTVFNRKNADEAKKRMLSTTQVSTFNSLGHRIWSSFIKRQAKPDPRKMQTQLKQLAEAAKLKATKSQYWENFWLILQGCELAKSIGYIPANHTMAAQRIATLEDLIDLLDEEPSGFVIDVINNLLAWSISSAFDGHIDFNDQIYMPTLFATTGWPEFPLTMVDEYQDLNKVNHHMIRRLVGNRRLIGVGDPNQSIYGFRGAMQGGMDCAIEDYDMLTCNLTVSFRCPTKIVEHVWWLVPDFKASRQGGSVRSIKELREVPEEKATFICRNNAPLFAMAIRLLNIGHSVNVAGSELGPKLQGILQKLGSMDLPQAKVLEAIDEWLAAKEAKGSKSGKDIAACLKVFAQQGPTLASAIAYCEHLFKQEGTINFTTGHRAKGLEWPVVYHLDPHLIDLSDPQDRNLMYVISTRSSNSLVEVASKDIHL